MASAAYPLHPGDPHWLQGVIHALVNLDVLPLVAICLLLISGRRSPTPAGRTTVRKALRVLRQAGEAPGSRSRHRGDPPPLDSSAPSERAESGPAEPGS
ncbi:MAG: hypothetical protein NTW51_11180 [Cyanobacteria bacterium]|nr:hypothetical protein [Cyanobacteriota bacterium]